MIACPYALTLAGLALLIETHPELEVVGQTTTADGVARLTLELRPDVLVLDLKMCGGSGLNVLEQLGPVPCTAVILLAEGMDKEDRARAYRLGVRGVLTKDASSEMLFGGIRAIMAGQYWPPSEGRVPLRRGPAQRITRREREVLAALVDGSTNREIANRLSISEDTVKHHVTNLFDKTGASTRVELTVFAIHHQLLDA